MIQSSGKERLYWFFFYLMAQEPQMRAKHGKHTHKNLALSPSPSLTISAATPNKSHEQIFDVIEKKLMRTTTKKITVECLKFFRAELKQCIAQTILKFFSSFIFFSLSVPCIVWFVSIHVKTMLLQNSFPRYRQPKGGSRQNSQQPVWARFCMCVLWNIYSNIPNVLIGKPHHNPKSGAYAENAKELISCITRNLHHRIIPKMQIGKSPPHQFNIRTHSQCQFWSHSLALLLFVLFTYISFIFFVCVDSICL